MWSCFSDDHYITFWGELSKLLYKFKKISTKHNNLYKCVIECRNTQVSDDDSELDEDKELVTIIVNE